MVTAKVGAKAGGGGRGASGVGTEILLQAMVRNIIQQIISL